jgi:hypothetical protein
MMYYTSTGSKSTNQQLVPRRERAAHAPRGCQLLDTFFFRATDVRTHVEKPRAHNHKKHRRTMMVRFQSLRNRHRSCETTAELV